MSKNWHDNVFFGLHFDLHANEHDKALGKDLTYEHLVQQLGKIQPDFVQCDCKGHRGMTSYPTKVGVPAPNIEKDAIKIWREATRELGVYLAMHYSGVWDAAALEKHPEWGRVNSPKHKGPSWIPPVTDGNYLDKNMTCPLSGYTDEYMSKQLIELIDWYDVDGFWVDGENWASAPCYCDVCKSEFTKQTGIEQIPLEKGEENWSLWLEFSRKNFEDHVRRFAKAVHDRKPECTVCSNWMYTVRQPDEIKVPVDYISGDFDWMWSVERANAEARFMDGRGLGWDLMAWGFTSYGPMKNWTFKSVPAMCQEAAVVMACGGAFMIYDQPNRTGSLVEWHMDKIAEVARFCRARQEYCQHTKSVPQVVILHDKDHFYKNNAPLYNFGGAEQQLEGALHAILDNQYHVDILSDVDLMKRIDNYKLCVISEQDDLSDEKIKRLKEYVYDGGCLIVSGAEQSKKFDDITEVLDLNKLVGEDLGQRVYIPDDRETVTMIGNWRLVESKDSDNTMPLLFERDLGVFEKTSGSPAALIKNYGKGRIATIFGPVFGTYFESHYPGIRRFIKRIVKLLDVDGLVTVDAPVCVNVTLREKENRLMVNFINLGSDKPLSPKSSFIENVPQVGPVKVSLSLEREPKAVYVAPGCTPVHWKFNDDCMLEVQIDHIGIHDILVIEKG